MKGVSEREWEAFDRVGSRVSPSKKKKSLLKMPKNRLGPVVCAIFK